MTVTKTLSTLHMTTALTIYCDRPDGLILTHCVKAVIRYRLSGTVYRLASSTYESKRTTKNQVNQEREKEKGWSIQFFMIAMRALIGARDEETRNKK